MHGVIRQFSFIFLVVTGIRLAAIAQTPVPPRAVLQNGYPELLVDGKPFFVHSATFAYFRIPRDLWESSLDRYRELGINTIDLPIPWNWHESRESEFDFDGHTNPRRDLRTLLKLVADKGFKLSIRAGPIIGSPATDPWFHGGYPAWLLRRPEYKMSAAERLAGAYPPAALLAAHDAESAAKVWLENATHVAQVQIWFAALAKELVPYNADRKIRVPAISEKTGESIETDASGPLIFVQLDDSPSFGATGNAGPAYWDYMGKLRRLLESAGVRAIFTINPAAMPAPAWAADTNIGITGQWFLAPRPQPPRALDKEENPAVPPGTQILTAADAATLQFLAEALDTQRLFPLVLSDYQAGWHAPDDDARPPASAAANTLLSSRLLLAEGLHGLNYAPLQDTLTPAGYESPGTNRYDRWDAALDLAGNRQPRARGVKRNGQMLGWWGDFLAAAHKRADFGLVDLRSSLAADARKPENIAAITEMLRKVQRVARLASLTERFIDLDTESVDRLLLDAIILLPVPEMFRQEPLLTNAAQERLVEYVRRGGTLVYFPVRPAGKVLEQLWQAATDAQGSASQNAPGSLPSWQFGEGRVIEWSKDFYSWASPEAGDVENRAKFEAAWAIENLQRLLLQAGIRPTVKRKPGNLLVTELVSDDGSGPLGKRQLACGRGALCGQGLLSVTNLSFSEMAEENLRVLSPGANQRGADEDYLPLSLQIPARESLLLPLHFPLCSEPFPGQKCDDEIIAAGAELLDAGREGHDLELFFYSPVRATVLFKLESLPTKIVLEQMNFEGQWTPDLRQLEIALPRGASPDFIRVLKIRLRYLPHVPEIREPRRRTRGNLAFSVADALRLPLGDDTALPSVPPLVLLDSDRSGQLLFRAENRGEMGRDVNLKVEGPVRGSTHMGLGDKETRISRVNLSPAEESSADAERLHVTPDGVFRGELQVRSKRADRDAPIFFVAVGKDAPARYRFDFDRDGAPEWVLENQNLRAIFSPESGGRVVALVEKSTGTNLTTAVGMLRDLFSVTAEGASSPPEMQDWTFNRFYQAEWVDATAKENANLGLRLSYAIPETSLEARVEKTIRLAGFYGIEVGYRISSGRSAARELLLLNSLSARDGSDRSTKFCWQTVASPSSPAPAGSGGTRESAAGEHCEPFVPEADSVLVPQGIERIEIHTPGRAGLAIECREATMSITRKRFAANLLLRFPAVAAGSDAHFTVRYTILPSE